MTTECPVGHPAEHVAVEVLLVPGRPFRVVHRCNEAHTLSDCTALFKTYSGHRVQDREDGFSIEWTETSSDAEAVADMARQALPPVDGGES